MNVGMSWTLGLDKAGDLAIWGHASAEGLVVISKDEDFFHIANQSNTKTQVLWVRLGNCRTQALLATIDALLPRVGGEFLIHASYGVMSVQFNHSSGYFVIDIGER
jgi:predicted nuclease of predicted toxin-antitoxin system